ncbi:uncharacterized protein B0I36DRAFT_367252 [Microdochium trichocladiopsis]|uniref:Zn(2)-C6 fungal-type domain-containing protein n=1 Tax=Microdochium trichocladiopsis TaxID=1682393 RepID=A0A9P8XYC3_9PEZI|nr:uncharacterized protein B0I36DRAFT_367252 [Microdochium trichocladiopsis]KAH7020769.1 hypothetical protein B0I36DRAFT_367252 [Microdochium trichocladiopsis]
MTAIPIRGLSPTSDSSTLDESTSDSAASAPSNTQPPPPKKQCWECQRRRVVCDSVEPVCGKCEAIGVVCPGFDDKKPLVWLAPGKVTARPRKKKRAPNGARAMASAAKRGSELISRLTGEKPEKIDLRPIERQLTKHNALRKAAGKNKDMYDSTFILFPELVYDKDIEQIFQAARYYDLQMYPEYEPILAMIPQAFIRRFELPTVPYFPMAIRHSVICITLGHRIHKLPTTTDPAFVFKSWEVFYRHRGKAIAGLTADMGSLDPVRRFIALIGTATFLMVDIQQCYPDWRIHYVGLRHLIDLCGGLDFVQSLAEETKSVMHVYMLCGMFANAITHRTQQLTCVSIDEQRRFIENSYDEKIMPYFMCPRTLLLAIVNINELRAEGMLHQFHLPDEPSPLPTPAELLAQIDAFDPVPWSDSITKGHQPQVVALGELFKTTTRLYCILSLQAVGLIPRTVELEVTKALHGDKLFGMLRAQMRSNILMQKSCLFSVAVAGFMAAHRGEEDRVYIRDECEFLSRSAGQASPLMLNVALQSFWESGRTEWDECFEQGYALSVC